MESWSGRVVEGMERGVVERGCHLSGNNRVAPSKFHASEAIGGTGR
jgi:hypothetical protein